MLKVAGTAERSIEPLRSRDHWLREGRRRELQALALVAPACLFLIVAFYLPIGHFLYRSIDNREIATNLPTTVAALRSWDGRGVPPAAAFATLVHDLLSLRDKPALAVLGRQLNYHEAGWRSRIQQTAKRLDPNDLRPAKQLLLEIDPRWGQARIWTIIQQESGPITPFYLLAAVDFERGADGAIHSVSNDRAIFRTIFIRTFVVSCAVCALCLVLGYPLAYWLATLPPALKNSLLLLVLLPLWTSLLVRTLAWMVIFQRDGVLNEILMATRVITTRTAFMRTWFSVLVPMVHLLLPLMVLPIYSVMLALPPSHVRAARSLGATPLRAFWSVYVPQTLPGIGTGVVLVSTLALGFFVTPEILGGPQHQMISHFVAFFTNISLDWGLAAALGSWLLVLTAILFVIAYLAFGMGARRSN